ncbi:hypothetical protein PGTUg99_023499 [Puccinia graminis f. sp. tritici]|uniref:Uncharacterized protein n=1 Tax=Puccinia graminis f. sp. tritici TaxID=56615 RepID=A0A5B0Q1T2_PUCGR|nr:hypothetical protein PGTUg99_023499 [Puccinia graminis f. sp. tritici]
MACNHFQNPSDLEEFEQGNLPLDEQSPVSTSRENAWMETMFDFDLWEKDHQPQDVIVLSNHKQTEDTDCDWDPTDVCLGRVLPSTDARVLPSTNASN